MLGPPQRQPAYELRTLEQIQCLGVDIFDLYAYLTMRPPDPVVTGATKDKIETNKTSIKNNNLTGYFFIKAPTVERSRFGGPEIH